MPTSRKENESQAMWIDILDRFLLKPEGDKVTTMVDTVYDIFRTNYADVSYLAARAIVCPTNAIVNDMNDFVFDKVSAISREYLSFDTL